MPNNYYTHTTYPTPNSPGASASMRAELELITAGFNKLPTLTANNSLPINVNAAGDAMEAGGAISRQDFTTTGVADAVARLTWNDTDGTLNLGLKGGNVVIQIGQEEVVRVLNNTGSPMTLGQAVYATGASGQRPTIGLAQANAESTSSKILGVVTESIANNAQGFVTTAGLVRDVNTIALTEGQIIWLSPTVAGGLTTTKPSAPEHVVMVGYCVRSHATQGIIYVKVQNGYELDELHDVDINSVAAYNMLRRNAANTLWVNIPGPTGSIVGTTDTQTLTNKTISGGTVTGATVTGLSSPSGSTDAATKGYVDTNDALKLNLSGGTLSGALAMGTNKITGLGDPTANQDAATKIYVDNAVQGLDAKASARVATTANITLSGTQTIDGVAVIAGDRILVKNQSAAAENGIYVVASGAWSRSTDANTWDELVAAFVFVEAGTTNANSGYVCTVAAGGTLGTTPVTWVQFSGAGQITAGAGLTKTGNQLDVGTASSARIVVNADNIDLATTGVSASTYRSVTVDTYGRVTSGTNPTTISGYGITDAYTTTQVDTALALKLNLTGGTMSGAIAMGTNKITGMGDPTATQDAATKNYVDTGLSAKLNLSGGTMSGALAMGTNKITGMGDPTANQDAATKFYVDSILGSATSAAASAAAAAISESNALTSANNAAASYDAFDDRYLGSKSSNPTVDNDGNPLLTGALYWNTVANEMRVYTGSVWVAAYVPSSGYLTTTDIGTTVQGYDGDLAAIAALTGTSGILKKTAANTWSLDTSTFLVSTDIGVSVQAYDADLTAWAGKTAPTGAAVGTSDAQTLTNKRIDPRVSTTASTASLTPDISAFDQYCVTAQAATLAINAPTGTPVDGNKLVFRILDNGVSRTLNWNATYTAIGVTLPTATTVSKTTYVGCVYNANNTRWDVIAVATQA